MADKSPMDYIDEVVVLLRRKNYKSALRLAKDAYERYPDDPFALSYYGCLTSAVGKKHDAGIKACKKAVKAMKKSDYDRAYVPAIYLNLGRAHLAAGNRRDAFDAFHKGLARDKRNKDILWELKKLGIRRPPPISFLGRANFLNKYLGKLRHWFLTR